MLYPILSPYLLSIGLSSIVLGFLVSIVSFVRIPLLAFSGFLSDLFDRRTLLALGFASSALGTLLLGTARDISLLIVARFIQGFFGAWVFPITIALVSDHIPKEKTGLFMAIFNASMSTGLIVGPALGGFLADTYYYNVVFIVSASILCAVSLLSMLVPSEKARLSEGLRGFRNVMNKELVLTYLITFADWLTLFTWLTFIPLYLVQKLGVTTTFAGIFISIESFAYTLTQIPYGALKDRIGGFLLVSLTLPVYPILLYTVTITSSNWLLVALAIAIGVVDAPVYLVCLSNIAKYAPKNIRGTASGFLTMATDLGALGPLTGGVILQATNTYEYIFIPTVTIAIVTALLSVRLHTMKHGA
jgi:DHA1 family multidrug resistance protein-like MFS transporter